MLYPKGTKRKEIKTATEQAETNIMNMFALKEENTKLLKKLNERKIILIIGMVVLIVQSTIIVLAYFNVI